MPWRLPPLSMVTTLAALVVATGASTAFAQRAPAASPPPAAQPAEPEATGADEEVERVARELFEQGRDAYANGQFVEARDLFQHSYDLSGRPGLLYNIAQASERMRDDQHALELYRAYIEAVPDASERDFVEARIVFLEERLRAQQAATSSDAADPGLDLGPLPLALMVGGGGLAAGGGVLLGLGIRGRNQVESAPSGSDYESVRGGGERARGLGYAGQVALGVGVAAALTGVILFVLSDPAEDDDNTRVGAPRRQLSLCVGLGDVTLVGSF